MGYDWNRFVSDLSAELMDLVDSGITTFARPLSEWILSKAEDQGIVLTQGQLEDLQKQLKDATKRYYDAIEQGSGLADTSKANPGGSAYWKRTAANAATHKLRSDEFDEIQKLSDKVDRATRDRDAARNSPLSTGSKLDWANVWDPNKVPYQRN